MVLDYRGLYILIVVIYCYWENAIKKLPFHTNNSFYYESSWMNKPKAKQRERGRIKPFTGYKG